MSRMSEEALFSRWRLGSQGWPFTCIISLDPHVAHEVALGIVPTSQMNPRPALAGE